MNLSLVEQMFNDFLKREPLNYMPKELGGFQLFSEAICGLARADDPKFAALNKDPGFGGSFCLPEFWLPEAKSVICIFFSASPELCRSNLNQGEPSEGWLYARYEAGDLAIPQAVKLVIEELQSHGLRAVSPEHSPKFKVQNMVSNWSKRHVAYIAGLGTFGLSKNIITAKGAAGRLASLVIDAAWPATPRNYEGLYDYCSNCGACRPRCPVGAIGEAGKEHPPCQNVINQTREAYEPRYGCGKCQTGVPCQSSIPNQKA